MSTIISQPRYTCALGAQQTVLAIPGGVPIIHAGPGCSSKAFGITSKSAGNQGEGYAGGNHISCTNAGESEVVFGGEKKLRSVIEGTLKVIKGDLYVALAGCTAGIIGDDMEAVARGFAKQGLPVVGVDTAGFRGSNYNGHEIVIKEILEQFVGSREPKVREGLVNVFCSVPYQDPFWRGDLEQIKELLERIGLSVNILFGVGSRGVEEWKEIPDAQFNLLISPWVGLEIVRYLQEKYGTPFLHIPIFPIGAKETSRFLRTVGDYAKLDAQAVEAVIEREERRYYSYFLSLADFISLYQNNLPFELYVAADSLYALGYVKYLEEEAGFIPKGIYIYDNPGPEHAKRIREILERELPEYADTLKLEADGELTGRLLQQELQGTTRALVIGTDWERHLAKDSGNLFLYGADPISQDIVIQKTYLGYRGGLNLLEDLYRTLFTGRDVSANNYVKKLSE